MRSASAKPRVMIRTVGSPFRSSRALVATVVPSRTEPIWLGGDVLAGLEAEQLPDAGHRGVGVGGRVVRQQLAGDQAPVRAAGDDVGERAAPVDPEFPAWGPGGRVSSPRGQHSSCSSMKRRARPVRPNSGGDGDRGGTGVLVQVAVRRLHVRRGQRGQVRRGRVLGQAHDPDVPAGAGALEQGPGEPAVAQLVDPARVAGVAEDGAEHLLGGRVEHVAGLFGQQVGDLAPGRRASSWGR